MQNQTVMRLYKLNEQLVYAYYVQFSLAEQAKVVVKKNPKLAKSLNPYIKEIEGQNTKLVLKGGDFYIAKEERMTE